MIMDNPKSHWLLGSIKTWRLCASSSFVTTKVAEIQSSICRMALNLAYGQPPGGGGPTPYVPKNTQVTQSLNFVSPRAKKLMQQQQHQVSFFVSSLLISVMSRHCYRAMNNFSNLNNQFNHPNLTNTLSMSTH